MPVYPGYVCAIVASLNCWTSRSNGWRTAANLTPPDSPDYIMKKGRQIAANRDGRNPGDQVSNSPTMVRLTPGGRRRQKCTQPGFFEVFTGS